MIFNSFILGDFLTFGKTQSETVQMLYLFDGVILLPALCLWNKFSMGAQIDSFNAIYNESSGIAVAVVFASLGFILRPLIHSELHMTYYRKQLSEASKFDFLVLTVWLPALVALMILGLASESSNLEIPFTTCVELLFCLLAYWLLADLEKTY